MISCTQADPTQLPDAELRASFYNLTSSGWHTLLKSKVLPAQIMSIPSGFYYYALNADGSCCDFLLLDSRLAPRSRSKRVNCLYNLQQPSVSADPN